MRDWPLAAKLLIALLVLIVVVPLFFRLFADAIIGLIVVGIVFAGYKAITNRR